MMTVMMAKTMAGLGESAASARPTDHPRADDLLVIGHSLADTLGHLLPHLYALRRAATAGHIQEEGESADALLHLAAWAGAVEAQITQYHQIKADVSGEGYALLDERGDGLSYFTDVDYSDRDGDHDEDAE